MVDCGEYDLLQDSSSAPRLVSNGDLHLDARLDAANWHKMCTQWQSIGVLLITNIMQRYRTDIHVYDIIVSNALKRGGEDRALDRSDLLDHILRGVQVNQPLVDPAQRKLP